MDHNEHLLLKIQQYLQGQLQPGEMHQLEREALDDPMLQDAIDGYRQAKLVDHRQLSLLQQRLENRIAGQLAEKTAFYFGWQRLAVAATAGLLFFIACILLWMVINHHQHKQAQPQKKVDVELTPAPH
ncbi:hypothetical protein SAMN05216436_11384 [bacterium A37T11]|nr:hypothetical protein SAMN05216436_11384 [bacterium A37T11]